MSEMISEIESAPYAHLDEDTKREFARVYGLAELLEARALDVADGLRD